MLIDEPVQLADGEQIITDEQQVKLTLFRAEPGIVLNVQL